MAAMQYLAFPMALVFPLALFIGVLSHLLLFIHHEWDRYAPKIVVTFGLIHLALLGALSRLPGQSLSSAIALLCGISSSYFTGLFGSIILYRALFHPLKAFPGPFLTKVTGLWSLQQSIPNFTWHLKVAQMHETYGDFVRVRPREISISHPDAIQDVHGPQSRCIKGPFYDLSYPMASLQGTRDKLYHSQRRRVWDRGFSVKAIGEYEPRVLKHASNLLSRLSELTSEPINAEKYFNYFSFDVIGDLAIGKSFNMLNNNGSHPILDKLQGIKPMTGILVCLPWLWQLVVNFPLVSARRVQWLDWCTQQLYERKQMTREQPDLFSYLVDDDVKKSKDPNLRDADLIYDSELALFAGSDTTSAALAAIFFLLARHQDKLAALQKEIDPLFTSVEDFSHRNVLGLPLLEGVIYEALRLFPPVPGGVQRETPEEGAMIAGRWIPGGTIVRTPTYTIMRDERCYFHPLEFIPERWSVQPELVKRKDTFTPFSTGTWSCVGKPLALLELRMVTALIVKKFNVVLANEESERIFTIAPGHKDCFVDQAPPLNVIFEERQ